MTGFGKCQAVLPDKKITLEIRSLNSKQLDLNMRLPGVYKEKEMQIRSLLATELHRGKIDFAIFIEAMGDFGNYSINQDLAKRYHRELENLAKEIDQKAESDYLSILSRMPDVLKNEIIEIGEDEWKRLFAEVNHAIKNLDDFRIEEGSSLDADFRKRTALILDYLSEIEKHEKERIKNVRERIRRHINEVSEEVNIDENRFEQEIIFYLEKLDITEEKTRLRKHCSYFIETMEEASPNGKKLNFISQEMGREINTLGAKASDANIQRFVVMMKDELEKIKEQVLNVL